MSKGDGGGCVATAFLPQQPQQQSNGGCLMRVTADTSVPSAMTTSRTTVSVLQPPPQPPQPNPRQVHVSRYRSHARPPPTTTTTHTQPPPHCSPPRRALYPWSAGLAPGGPRDIHAISKLTALMRGATSLEVCVWGGREGVGRGGCKYKPKPNQTKLKRAEHRQRRSLQAIIRGRGEGRNWVGCGARGGA